MTSRAAPWRAVAPHAIAWREWNDELVVYNDATGNTHHLAPLGGKVLIALLTHPSGIELSALVQVVAETAGIPDAQFLAPNVEEALTELAGLQLAACDSA